MIRIYEWTGNTDLNEDQASDYIKFCNKEMQKLFPKYEIEVLDEPSLYKVEITEDFKSYQIEDEFKEDIEIEMSELWEKWERQKL